MNPIFTSCKKNKSQRYLRGFTLVEVLIAVSILAVLIALALPSFTTTIQRWRVSAIRDDLNTTIMFAKSEAVRRSTQVPPVTVTIARIGAAGCPAMLNIGNNNVWSCGWQVFLDANNNGILDSNETLIQTTTVPAGYAVTDQNAAATGYAPVSRWGQLVQTDLAQTPIPATTFVVSPMTAAGLPDTSNLLTTGGMCINGGITRMGHGATCS